MTDDELNDRVDAWHDGDSELPLHEFLGMTWDEYARWTESAVIPQTYLERLNEDER